MSQWQKMYACSKQSSSVSSKKESLIVVLQENITKTSWRDSLHSWESDMAAGGLKPRQRSSVGKASRKFEAERHEATKGRCRRWKEQAVSQSSSAPAFECPKCSMVCASRISLYSRQRTCKNWPSTFRTILVCEEWAIITSHHLFLYAYSAVFIDFLFYLHCYWSISLVNEFVIRLNLPVRPEYSLRCEKRVLFVFVFVFP